MPEAAVLTIDVSGLGDVAAIAAQFGAAGRRALRRAFSGEAYRMKRVLEDALRRGVGPSPRSLSVAEEAAPTTRALSAMARFVAYRVDDAGPGIRAEIGFGQGVTRAKSPEGRRVALVSLLSGVGTEITREDQMRIAGKVRKRQARRTVAALTSRGVAAPRGSRSPKKVYRGRWPEIGFMLPKVGTSLQWPERDLMGDTLERERGATVANVSRLFFAALRGERWTREWWRAAEIATPGRVDFPAAAVARVP